MTATASTAGSAGGTQIACPRCAVLNRIPAGKSAVAGKCGKCGAPLFSGAPINLTEATADAHLSRGDVPVLIDFWAAWCGPCRVMGPVFAEAAGHLEPKVRLAKVDTEAEPALAARFAIRAIPSLVLVHKGREVARTSGAMPLNGLLSWVRQNV